MKKILLTISILTIAFLTNIQKADAQVSAGISFGLGVPTGDLADPNYGGLSNAVGGEIHFRYNVEENMAVGLNIGYYSWGISGTVPTGIVITSTSMPITGEFAYFLGSNKVRPFIGLEAGYTSWTMKAEVPGIISISQTFNGLALAPFGGVAFGLNDNLDLFAKAKYFVGLTEDTNNGAPNMTYIGINAGMMFKF